MTLEEAMKTLDLADAQAVAELLMREGVKGERRDCIRCPVAVYLRKMIGQAVSVGHGLAMTRTGMDIVFTPKAVSQFIGMFDDECLYPQLINS